MNRGLPLPWLTRLLCACLVLLAGCSPTSAENPKSQAAILIAARPDLPDPHFKDSVVLVANNIASAPIGVIVNRPTRITVSQLFPDIGNLAAADEKVYFGGPVGIASVLFVFRSETAPDKATRILDGVYLSGSLELLRKLLRRDKPMEGLRIFAGHSGWAPGQLEGEIGRGDWTLLPANADEIFNPKSEHPWPERQTPEAGQRT